MPSTITNLSGSWTGEEKNGSLRTYEWFGLTPSGIYPYPNIYWQTGYGPGYDFSGYCMVSGQKKIAFGDYRTLISPTETNIVRRATVGSFIKKTTLVGGNTKGLSDLGTNVISYNAFLVTPLVEATKQ